MFLRYIASDSVTTSAVHTAAGCKLKTPMAATGNILHDNCDAYATGNAGCGVRDTSVRTFGQGINRSGGATFAMHWDESGERCSNSCTEPPRDLTLLSFHFRHFYVGLLGRQRPGRPARQQASAGSMGQTPCSVRRRNVQHESVLRPSTSGHQYHTLWRLGWRYV